MNTSSNIVQIEFFQANVRANSLESLMADAFSRNADGAALKLTLRFFDSLGEVTALAAKIQSMEKWTRRLEICIAAKTGWRQAFANSLHQTNARFTSELKRRCVACAADQLRFAIDSSAEVAIEEADHSFRLLSGNEVYETLTRAGKARGAWIFIFKPNDLMAKRNESVAYVM